MTLSNSQCSFEPEPSFVILQVGSHFELECSESLREELLCQVSDLPVAVT